MVGYAEDIVSTFDFVAARFTARLDGLTDDEYRWEPVAGCWSVRQDAAGEWVQDHAAEGATGDGPVTTIAWRMVHLACHALGGFGIWLRDGGDAYVGDPDVPATAAAGLAALERNWTRFREGMVALDDARWLAPIGPAFGPYAESSHAGLVLHVLDEYVHHAAEISLLRDLYRDR